MIKLGQKNSIKRQDGEWWIEREANHFILICYNHPIEDVVGEFETADAAWADLAESNASVNAERHYNNQVQLVAERGG